MDANCNPSTAIGSFFQPAPRDIFQQKQIGYRDGRRIACKGFRENASSKEYVFIYLLDNTIQLDALPSILRAFETDEICFAECECWGYDDDDHRAYCAVRNIDDLAALHNFWNFEAAFCHRETNLYQFSLWADINSSNLSYSVKFADLNRKQCNKGF